MKVEREDKRTIDYYFKIYYMQKLNMKCSCEFLCDNSSESSNLMLWLEVVEKTIKKFENSEKSKLIVKRFFKREKEAKIFMGLFIDRSTYYLWQHEIYEYAYVVAVSKQLLEID